MLNTPWHSFRLEGIGSGKLATRARDVLKILGEQGLRIPAGNRLERAAQQLERVNTAPENLHSMTDDEAEQLIEATRTIFEAFYVTWAFTERENAARALPIGKFTAFFEGADMPSQDANPHARNTQFELVAATHFLLGGADLRHEEPDFTILFHGTYVGLAVKRLTSVRPATLSARLREGVRQIERAKGIGFIAVNLDNWITDLPGDEPEEVGRRFEAQLTDAYREIAKLAARKSTLLGIAILGTWLRWRKDNSQRRLEWQNPFQMVGFADDDADQKRFDEFFPPLRARWETSMIELGSLIQSGKQAPGSDDSAGKD